MPDRIELSARSTFAKDCQAEAHARRLWARERFKQARGHHLLALRARWRVQSAVYNRFGTVVAMAQEAEGDGWPMTGDQAQRPAGSAAQLTAPIRALVVDADVPTRVGVRMILSSAHDIDVVAEASSGEDAITQAIAHRPDVVLMAIRLPGMDGISATARITAALGEATRVIVLTTFDGDEYERRARRAGASAFLPKQAARPDTLIAAVHAVVGEGQPSPPRRAAPRARLVAVPGNGLSFIPPLTERERTVLSLVAVGLSNTEIGEQLEVSVETVKSHLKHIYAKSGVSDRARLVVAAQAEGFSLPPPTPSSRATSAVDAATGPAPGHG